MTANLPARLISGLKNTLWAMGEKTRSNRCRKAIARASDFDGEGAQQRALPGMATRKRDRCANHLADNMSRPMPTPLGLPSN